MAQNGSKVKKLKAATEMAEFDSLLHEIVDELTKNELNNPEVADAFTWFKQVLQYNVPHAKKFRGVSVVTYFQLLVPDASENDIKIARVLDWCIELYHTNYLMADDIMDHSLTRGGQPCWYKQDNVGLIAINDSSFLKCSVFVLLKKYVRGKPYYMPVTDLFTEIIFQSVIGQCLDMTTALPEAKVDFTQFTMERYNAIAKWKTAIFYLYLPLALAMHMYVYQWLIIYLLCLFLLFPWFCELAGISDEESHAKAKTIFLQLGHFIQVQDDYLDCYGVCEALEKVGTDIENNKCCWLIVKALEIASDEQKEELKLNYGRWDKEAVTKVKAIYKDLNLEEVYKQYEESSYQDITNLINSIDSSVPKEVFLDLVNKIYKHEK